MRQRAWLVSCLAAIGFLAASPGAWAASHKGRGKEKAPVIKPSENKGRLGTYFEVKTHYPGNQYHVYVPKSYSETNPAGIHVHFSGQGGCKSNKGFGRWAKHFLDPYNLIGLNMQYLDGDNAKATETKMKAAAEAVLQLQADYKIIVGRGVITSFSGGGLPHALYFQRYGRQAKEPTAEWTFNHIGLYGSNYRLPTKPQFPTSAFVGVGEKEWNMGRPILGKDMPDRAAEFFRASLADGCGDVFFNYTKGKGHSISDEDVARSAAQFRRSDLAFCAFLYEPDFASGPLRSIVRKANKLKLGTAAKALDRLLAKETLDAEVRKQAEGIKEKLDARAEAIVQLCREMVENDVPLLTYYEPIYSKQLKGHPQEKALKEVLTPFKKLKKKGKKTHEKFAQEFPQFLTASGRLKEGEDKVLEGLREGAGKNSTIGQMATRLLDFK